jgi:hypothetical protein
VKYCLCSGFYFVVCAGFTLAQTGNTQSASALYSIDINGHVVTDADYVARNGDKAQLNQSINGRQVPLESSEVRVLTNEPNHRVTETIVHKYDPTGQSSITERTITDEAKSGAGSTIHATVYRSDLNGSMAESERRVVENQVQGATTTAEVTILRPGLSGSFETAEKRKVVTVTDGDTVRTTEDIQRPSGNGSQLFQAARVVTEETKSTDKSTSSTALYELDVTGKLALSRQDVATTTKTAAGSVTQLNTYAPSIYGVAREENGGPKLREQETIVREEKNGVVTQTTAVRRPTLQDPNRLDDPKVLSTLVCTGSCKDSLFKAAAPAPASKP